MKKKIYYKNLVFSKLNVFDISLGYLNWFKKKERTKFIIKKPNSLIQLNNFVKKCNKDKGVLLVGVFDKMKNHLGNVKFDEFDYKKKSCTLGILTGEKKYLIKNNTKDILLGSIKFLKLYKKFSTCNLGVNKLNTKARKIFFKSGFRLKNTSITRVITMSLKL
jgi:hypothetical protein